MQRAVCAREALFHAKCDGEGGRVERSSLGRMQQPLKTDRPPQVMVFQACGTELRQGCASDLGSAIAFICIGRRGWTLSPPRTAHVCCSEELAAR